LQSVLDRDEVPEERDVIRFLSQVLGGLAFLHQFDIAHLDLKVTSAVKLFLAYPRNDAFLMISLVGHFCFFSLCLLTGQQPQNLVLTGPFPNCDIKLCDFGIARHIARGADVREILGTPDYVGE